MATTEEAQAKYRACVTGAIFHTVAFLEATINELFTDVVENVDTPTLENLVPTVRVQMAEWWKLGAENFRTLRKFEAALLAGRNMQLNRGHYVYQNVDSLIILRNSLIHYQPQWLPTNTETRNKIEQRLWGKFSLDPWFESTGNPFYPYKCISAGCAKWAVSSSLAFTEDFFKSFGTTPLYSYLLPFLKNK